MIELVKQDELINDYYTPFIKSKLDNKQADYEKEIKNLDKQMDRIKTAYIKGVLKLNDFDKEIEHIEYQRTELTNKLKEQKQYENLSFTVDDLLIIQDKQEIDTIEDIGTIIIPGKYFLEIIRKIDDEYLNIETDGLKIIISTKRGEYSLNGMNSKEFPNIKMDLSTKPIKISQKILKTIINQTCFAVSTQESRPILTGINMTIDNDNLICVATDSYRLAKKIVKLDEIRTETTNIVIPGKNLLELSKILEDEEKNLELHIFPTNVLIKTENMLFQSRLLNGSYPDTSKLIPTDFELTLTLPLIEFYNTIDRVSLLTTEKDKNLVKMEVIDDNLMLSSTSQEIGKMEENMKVEKSNEKEIKIAFSSKYMMEALKTFETEDIEIFFNSEIKPIIIKNIENEDLIQLILPIRTY